MAVLTFPGAGLNEHLKDFKPSTAVANSRFHFWHVESLLNQAADLLDRCLMEQAKYDSLRAQASMAVSSLRADEEPLAIEEGQVTAGAYDFPLNDAIFKNISLNNLIANEVAARTSLVSIDNLNQLLETHASAIEKERARVDIQLHELTRGRGQMERELASREEAREAGDLGRVSVQKILLKQARVRLEERRSNMSKDGPLDFSAQADRSLLRLRRDHADAVDRLIVASDGMSRIYGYTDHFLAQTSPTAFDDAVLWAREAIRWLAAFSQKDQTFTVTVSLHRALGNDWSKIQTENKELFFAVDPSFFKGHRYVRLRGLSASMRLAPASGPFPLRCVVKPPNTAVFTRLADDGTDDPLTVSQAAIPPCTLGRIMDCRVPLEPEVCGAISLMNASPIAEDTNDDGRWSLHVQRITEDELADLQDIFLELRVTGQPLVV
jgi:hypothetical protein